MMSENLKSYLNEWYEILAAEEKSASDTRLKKEELYSIQNAVRAVAENEMDTLTAEEKMEVEKILSEKISTCKRQNRVEIN